MVWASDGIYSAILHISARCLEEKQQSVAMQSCKHPCRAEVKLDTRFLSRTMLGFCARTLTSASSIHPLSSKRKATLFSNRPALVYSFCSWGIKFFHSLDQNYNVAKLKNPSEILSPLKRRKSKDVAFSSLCCMVRLAACRTWLEALSNFDDATWTYFWRCHRIPC